MPVSVSVPVTEQIYKVVVGIDGSKTWYQNNQLHREDGPAVERFDGSKSWYLNGKELSEKEFKEHKNVKF